MGIIYVSIKHSEFLEMCVISINTHGNDLKPIQQVFNTKYVEPPHVKAYTDTSEGGTYMSWDAPVIK